MVDDGVLRQLDEWAQIVVHDAVFDGILVQLRKQYPAFLSGAVTSWYSVDG